MTPSLSPPATGSPAAAGAPSVGSFSVDSFSVDNRAGWSLTLKRYWNPASLVASRPPVVMVPGYAMNSFILSFHPGGRSMIGYLVDQGYELWTTDLRAQGDSRRTAGPRPLHLGDRFGLAELAVDDLPRMFDRVRALTASSASTLHAVGCSLGASLLYGYLAHHRDNHGLRSLTAIGGPLRWDAVHPALRVAFASGRLAGLIPFAGTRALARAALPLVKHAPGLLSLYMNAREIDLSQADQLVKTVEDPVPYINRQVARWVSQGDLVVRGVNVSDRLQGLPLDVHCVLANADGIVPRGAAASVADIVGASRVTVLEVGTAERWYAHADLFIGPQAEAEVFAPMARWLELRSA